MNMAQATIEGILAVLGDRLVHSTSICFSRLEALWDVLVIATIVRRINLLRLAPPAWIHDWIYAC